MNAVFVKSDPEEPVVDADRVLDVDMDMDIDNDGSMAVKENISSSADNITAPAIDKVVQEIDVYLSPEFSNQMYLLQFPLQQHHHESSGSKLSEFSAPEEARLKPHHGLLELDQRIPSNIETYGSFHLPLRSYTSQTIPISMHMAIGKLHSVRKGEGRTGAIHLVPLSHITQLRPTFHHVDEATANAQATTAAEEQQELENQKHDGDDSTPKPISFHRKESERAELARKSSYAYKKQSEESESWQTLQVYDKSSTESQLLCNKITSQTKINQPLLVSNGGLGTTGGHPNSVAADDDPNILYVQSMNYLPIESQHHKQQDGEEPSRQMQHTESQDRKCTELDLKAITAKSVVLLQKGFPTPYMLIRSQFPVTSVSDSNLIRALTSCAVVVRGNFVIQSKLLKFPNHSIAVVRDFILFLFQTIGVVHQSQLEHVFCSSLLNNQLSISKEHLTMVLEQIGYRATDSHGWRLKVDDDLEFVQRHPQAVVLAVTYWKSQMEQFEPFLENYHSAPV